MLAFFIPHIKQFAWFAVSDTPSNNVDKVIQLGSSKRIQGKS
jgi:hypothetical protein